MLHLEAEIPTPKRWLLGIDGLVHAPRTWTVEQLIDVAHEEHVWDMHCVWGWSRPGCRWGGVPVGWLLDHVRPKPDAAYGLVSAQGRRYASCLSLSELRDSLVALTLDGEPLPSEHGGPIRLVPPPRKWAYKGVKWVSEMLLIQTFTPGFWETLVGNPHGDVPAEMLDLRFE